MKGIVNWYSDKKKQGLIEGQNGENIVVYEKDMGKNNGFASENIPGS